MIENSDLNELLKKGLEYHKNNKFIEALEIYKKILIEDSNHFETNFYMGTLLAQTKKFTEASSHIIKAIKIKPEIAELHNNLGLIYKELNEFKKSISCFEEAIKISPKFAMAYNNLGIVNWDLNKFEDAEKNFLKSAELNSENSETYNYLGLIYRKKDFERAKYYFEKCLKLNPKNFIVLNNLGNLYKNFGNAEISEKYFTEAISINENYFDAYNNLMDLFDKTNQNDNFLNIINKSKIIFNNNSIISLFYGLYLFKTKNYHKSITTLEKISFNNNELNRERLRSQILAKNYDKIKNYDAAFDHFTKTNQINLLNKDQNIDKNRIIEVINERIKSLDQIKTINKKEDLTINSNHQLVFMIGFPRSGTTLLDTILRSHELIEVLEEKPIVPKLIVSLKKKVGNNFNNITKEHISLLQNEYFENIKNYSSNNKKIIIDKMPLNIIYTAEIFKIFPKAKFIISLRHPVDTVLSCYMQSFKLNDAMANFLNLEDSAKMYDKIMTLWIKCIEKLDIDYHEVKYESLVKDFDKTVQETLKFINVEWSDEVIKFYDTAKKRGFISTPSYDQVNQPIYKDSLNRWKNYQNHTKNIFPILDRWIKKFNY